MKTRIKYLVASVTVALYNSLFALAQPQDMGSTLNRMSGTIKTWAQPLVNLVLVALGIFAIGRAVSAYIASRRSQQGGGNEELITMITTTLIVVGFIFLVNAIFFNG